MPDKKRVLIAEDSSVIQNLTKKILQFQNFEITGVKNGKEVMDFIGKNDVDVILMDIIMPQMDGMECARQVRALADPVKKNVPIIAITGNAHNYTVEDFHAVGINEFLPKPLDFDLLVEVVKKYTAA